MAREEGNGRLGALRRAAGVGYLGEAVVGADMERVGRVGAAGIHLLPVAIRTFAHCEKHAKRWEFSVFLQGAARKDRNLLMDTEFQRRNPELQIEGLRKT